MRHVQQAGQPPTSRAIAELAERRPIDLHELSDQRGKLWSVLEHRLALRRGLLRGDKHLAKTDREASTEVPLRVGIGRGLEAPKCLDELATLLGQLGLLD